MERKTSFGRKVRYRQPAAIAGIIPFEELGVPWSARPFGHVYTGGHGVGRFDCHRF